jgi:hypothetical protein
VHQHAGHDARVKERLASLATENVNQRSPNRASPAVVHSALSRYSLIARVLDQAFRVPGTSWRFGLDPLLGLLPGAGDLITALIGAYGLVVARELGAPASVQLRMLGNLAVDATLGAIPILGDIFDFAFKAHVRNLLLLEKWLTRPHEVQRTSILLLLTVLVGLLALVVGTAWLAIISVRMLIQLIS